MIKSLKTYIYLWPIVFALTLVIITPLTQESASAISGNCFFGNNGGNCSAPGCCGDYGTNDVLTGRDGNGNGSAIPGSVNTKAEYINYIQGRLAAGGHNKAGAAYIISLNTGDKSRNPDFAQWRDLINQPAVTVSKESVNIYRSSFYDPGKNDVFMTGYSPGVRTAIVVRHNGNVVSVVEVGCGNPANQQVTIPDPPSPPPPAGPNWRASISSSASPTVTFVGQPVTYSHVGTIGGTGTNMPTTPTDTEVSIWNDMRRFPAGRGQGASLPTSNTQYYNNPGTYSDTGYLWPSGRASWIETYWEPHDHKGQVNHPYWDPTDRKVCDVAGANNCDKSKSQSNGHWHWVGAWKDNWYRDWIGANRQRTVTGGFEGTISSSASVNVVQSSAGVDVQDYEKGSNDNGNTVTHRVTLTTCSVGINTPWSVDGWSNGVQYHHDFNSYLGPGNGCTATWSTTNSAVFLNNKDPITSFQYITTTPNQTIPKTMYVYEVPYTTFKGHDIYAAGSGSGNLPAPNNSIPSGSIFFNSASGNRGSRDQYASIANHATNVITTAVERLIAPIPISASSTGGLSARWPTGKAPSSAWSTITTNGSLPQTVTGTTSTLPATSGYYTATTPTISGTGIPNTGRKITVKSSGNITINDNIQLSSIPTAYNKDNSVILLISDGDINISPNVTRIDAILIAKGKINTCSGPSRANWHQASPAGCRNPLVVNGAMGASFINFGRSIGTRYLNNGAAEEIKYPEYLNFATPYLRDYSTNSSNAIFNAPPLL